MNMSLEMDCTDSGTPAHLSVRTLTGERQRIQLCPSAITVELGAAQVRALVAFLQAWGASTGAFL